MYRALAPRDLSGSNHGPILDDDLREHNSIPIPKPKQPANASVQLQALYHHCGEAASEKCLAAATFVRRLAQTYSDGANAFR